MRSCGKMSNEIQYIPRNMHTVFALLCFVVVIHWLIFPYPSGLLHWHCGNLTIAPVPAKQPWWIWINTSCELIMNDCITTTKQSTTKPCAYFLGYTVWRRFQFQHHVLRLYFVVYVLLHRGLSLSEGSCSEVQLVTLWYKTDMATRCSQNQRNHYISDYNQHD